MKPITHAKITFFICTLIIVPQIIHLVAKVIIGQVFKKQNLINDALNQSKLLLQYRLDKTEQTYKFHKNGYQFILKSK